jgi:regulatory protein
MSAIDYKKLLYKKLGIKSYTTEELRGWLLEKGATEVMVTLLLQECQQLGYLNDEAYREAFVRQARARHYGPSHITMKLKQKGFSEEEISEALCSESDEEASIQQLLQSRYRSRDLKNARERQKVIASLMRRGFSYDSIIANLKLKR